MNNSEIIAIVAIIASALTSIVTVVVGYYQNKSNNRAKLSEIAFEKRIEAFRDVYEAIVKVRYACKSLIYDYKALTKDAEEAEMRVSVENLRKVFDSCASQVALYKDINAKNKVYMPPSIDLKLRSIDQCIIRIGDAVVWLANVKGSLGEEHAKRLVQFGEELFKDSDAALAEMRKFIGYE